MTPHMDVGDGQRVRQVGGWLAELGLRAVSFHAPFYAHLEEARAGRWLSLAHPDEAVRKETVERVKTALWAMAELGARTAIIHPAAPGRAQAADTGENLRESLERLLPLAESLGTTLALENIPAPLGRPAEVAGLVERYNHPLLRVCIDSGHAHLTEGDETAEAYRLLAPWAAATHLHDNDGARDGHLVPGEGGVPWQALWRALDAASYSGPLTFELRRAENATYPGVLEALSRSPHLPAPPRRKPFVKLSETEVPPMSVPTAAGVPTAARDALRQLAKEHLGAEVDEETPLAGDASDRSYVRLHHPAAAPTASVGMILPAPWKGDALPFLRIGSLLAKTGIPVPTVYGANPAAGVILLEDAGDEMLEDLWNRGGWEAARAPYQKAVDILLTLQGKALRVEAAFDPETFTRELHHTRRHAFEALLKMEAPEAAFADAFKALSAEICRLPFRLAHRDYHSRNLMVAGGALTVLDFQDARMGPVTYDLASLIFDSYVSLPEKARGELIRRYLAGSGEAQAFAGGGSFASGSFARSGSFEEALALTALQRNLKAIGTFAFQWSERGTPRYLSHIPPTVGHIRGHLEKLPCWDRFADQLAPYLDALSQIQEENFS